MTTDKTVERILIDEYDGSLVTLLDDGTYSITPTDELFQKVSDMGLDLGDGLHTQVGDIAAKYLDGVERGSAIVLSISDYLEGKKGEIE